MIRSGSWIVPASNHRFSLLVSPPPVDQARLVEAFMASRGQAEPDPLQDLGLQVVTGIWGGPVLINLEVLSEAPTLLTHDHWEDVEETSVKLGEGTLTLGNDEVRSIMIGSLESQDHHRYRFRIYSSGRDINRDQIVEEPSERYLLQCWPEPLGRPPLVLRSGSSYGGGNYEPRSLTAKMLHDPQVVEGLDT